MRIEMCGPPTAGKSQLVKSLSTKSIAKGKNVKTNGIPPQWKSFKEFVEETYKGTSYKKLPVKTLYSLEAAWVGDNHPKFMVFDELVILCGFSMAIRLPKECSDRYFVEAPLPHTLIYLTADKNILLRRNLLRGEKNRPEKTMRMVDACNKYIPVLKERGCNILSYNTTKLSTEQIANDVLKKIGLKK